jgi:hypothetical protein
MYSIALLIPVCGRGKDYKTIDDTPFVRIFYPNFLKTYNPTYNYTIYLGIDNTDSFYVSTMHLFTLLSRDNIIIKPILLESCEHKPAFAWNKLFEVAYKENNDYFYQIGDDIKMLTPWVDRFIEILSAHDNNGVVGGCHDANYYGRINQKKTPVIENAFVHRKHYQIFNTFFNKSIENWYCDDWITEVYKPNLSTLCIEVKVVNTIMARYAVKDIGGKIQKIILEDIKKLKKFGTT